MNTRKLAAALAALLLTNVLLAAFAAAKDFADVPDGHWAREDIRYVTERGLFLGKTPEAFEPSSGMTRGQMAAVLYRLAGLPDTDAPMRYSDVPETSYYYDAIRWANGNAIFTEAKQAADALTPDETVTRGEFAVMLRNYDRTKTNRMPTETVLTDAFEDMDETTPEVREAVLGWAYPNGILRGTSEATMNPDGRLTRAHVAAMLSRYDKATVNDSGFKFRVAPPHTMEELYTGRLAENEVYALLVSEEYADSVYALASDNPGVMEIAYADNAWKIRTKNAGNAVLTATDKRTGVQWTLPVTVGNEAEKPASPAENGTGGTKDELRKERLKIVEFVNEARKRGGLREVAVSEALMDAAQAFAETLPTGHDLTLETECRNRFGCCHGAGCNLYYASGYDPSILAANAVAGWTNSRGHYVAMMNDSADSVGIGAHYDEDSGTYYCVMFIGDCRTESALFGNPHR